MLYDKSISFSDEIHEFHDSTLYPELERCASNPASIAQVFTNNCQTMKSLYSAYCQNMSASRQAVANLGGEATPTSILLHCQQEVRIFFAITMLPGPFINHFILIKFDFYKSQF